MAVTVTIAAITTATLQKSPATFYSPSTQTHHNLSFSGGLRLPNLTIKLKTRSRCSDGVFGAKMTDSAAVSYAVALAEVPNSNGTLDATLSDIEKINKHFSDNESVLSFFTSPIVTLEKKHKLIDDITSSGLLELSATL
ncbi:hypothetical protein M8C21_033439 [Ambrosia artemisiifolia]|uniref:Uncharacterized protein n=1 Tax=Ambrosia artemisiifolia TaxID=4212 RepID=A0AAD5BT12_AMBAR|nr:hypothetical protein M8C21_033439 [Ambrosia artemisiifolia]